MSDIIEKLGITPGPWHVNQEGFGNIADHKTVYATGDELRYVARCEDYANIIPTNNGANANLIAAAPEMLERDISFIKKIEAEIEKFKRLHDAMTVYRYKKVLELFDFSPDLKATGKTIEEIKELII